MKFVIILLSLSVLVLSCGPTNKIQTTQQTIFKKDTTPVVVVKDDKTVNSSKTIPDIYNKVIKNKINFTTFNAKVRVEYNGSEGGNEATAYIRIRKDSAIWMSLRGPFGIEGFRVLVTNDSVIVMDQLKNTIQNRTISFLHDVTGLPFDFATLQNIIVGNPVFIDSNISAYSVNNNNQLQVQMVGHFFKHLLLLDNNDYTIINSKLEDISTARNRSCNIAFSDYENAAEVSFSTRRKISVTGQSKLNVNLEFKQYSFNQQLTFPFNIPKNYKKL